MKKLFSVVLCLILSLSMLLTMTGCFGEQSKYIGTWKANLDFTEIMNDELANDVDMGGYFTITDFSVVMYLEFNDDGTYSMWVEEDSVEQAMEQMIDDLTLGMEDYLTDYFASEGITVTVQEALDSLGMTMDELMDDSFDDEMMDETVNDMLDAINGEGNFKVEGDRLFLSDGLEYAVDEDVYDICEISGDILKMLEGEGYEDGGPFANLYPVTFTRVS